MNISKQVKSSTPSNSPARRLLTNASANDIELEESDVENELKGRRLEAINRSNQQERTRKSVVGLNASELKQHSLECMKLSAENRINSKNAFSLLLIDMMAAMLKKNDSEITKNFQIAGRTLDASVKIYGYRVDAVHTDAMKIAGGIVSAKVQPEEGVENNEGGVAEEGGSAKKKRSRRKHKATIVPPNTLNNKSEDETLLDAVPRPTTLLRQSVDIVTDLLTRVPRENDAGVFLIDSDLPVWPYDGDKPSQEKENDLFLSGETPFEIDELLQLHRGIVLSAAHRLCPSIDVEFGKDRDEENELSHLMDLSQPNNYEFDLNASVDAVDDVQEEINVAPQRRLNLPVEGYNSDEDILLPEVTKPHVPVSISDMKRKVSIQPMEYSFFDEKVFKSWAGPTYWRVRPSRLNLNEANKENEDGSRPVPLKRTRKAKVKEPLGLFEVDEETLENAFVTSEKTLLAKATLFNWKTSNLTLSEDYKHSTKQLFTLFCMPFYTVEPRKDVSHLEEVVEDNVEEEPDQQELQYCSQSLMDPDEEPQELETIRNETSTAPVEEWGVDNMLAIPNKVTKIKVNTFQKRKNVDMKVLKRSIWSTITEGVDIERPLSFSELLSSCPAKLPRLMLEGLSAPLIFNALLHLSHEKSLKLQQSAVGDFTILQ